MNALAYSITIGDDDLARLRAAGLSLRRSFFQLRELFSTGRVGIIGRRNWMRRHIVIIRSKSELVHPSEMITIESNLS